MQACGKEKEHTQGRKQCRGQMEHGACLLQGPRRVPRSLWADQSGQLPASYRPDHTATCVCLGHSNRPPTAAVTCYHAEGGGHLYKCEHMWKKEEGARLFFFCLSLYTAHHILSALSDRPFCPFNLGYHRVLLRGWRREPAAPPLVHSGTD